MADQKKMDNCFSLEALAIGVAHAVYRNTAVEDYHAEGRCMDDALYEDVRRIVSEKAALLIKSMPLLLCAHRNGWASIRTLNNISPEETSFFQEVVFGILCGSGWEARTRSICISAETLQNFYSPENFGSIATGRIDWMTQR